MEPMLIGTTVNKKASDTTTFEGYWMPRQGDEATYAVEVIAGAFGDFQFLVWTKNSEDADSAKSPLGSATPFSALGITKLTVSGAKEWVRYDLQGKNNVNKTSLHFRFLEPQWAYNQ